LIFAANALDARYEGNLVFQNDNRRLTLPFAARFDRAATTAFTLTSAEDHHFGTVAAGNTAGLEHRVTIRNTGTTSLLDLNVTLTGENALDFTLEHTSISPLLPHAESIFIIRPNTSLPAGSYTTTVTVSANSAPSLSFDVSLIIVVPPVDFSALQATVDAANRLLEMIHTPTSWAAFSEVLTHAEARLTDPDAIQFTVDAAHTDLLAAMEQLRRGPFDVNGDGVIDLLDVVSLRALIVGLPLLDIDEALIEAIHDGVVGDDDVMLLRRYIAGFPIVIGP